MLNYYYDFEFIEGFKKPISFLPSIGMFNKKMWTIQLVSVGIRCSDGRKYKAISSEFNECDADDWVRKNVLAKLPPRFIENPEASDMIPYFDPGFFPLVLNPEYKTNAVIAKEIFNFMNSNHMNHEHAYFIGLMQRDQGAMSMHEWLSIHEAINGGINRENLWYASPALYGYYSAYDHVVMCTLFGRMIDLPTGFPMFTIDLKQKLDELCWEIARRMSSGTLSHFEFYLDKLKAMDIYPVNGDEHDPLADAEWNMELHKFISVVKQHFAAGRLILVDGKFKIGL